MSRETDGSKFYMLYKQCANCRVLYRVEKLDSGYYWYVVDEEDDIIRMRYSNKNTPDEDFLAWAENYLPREVKK